MNEVVVITDKPGQKYPRMARIPCAGSEGISQEMPGNISTFYSVREALLKKAMFSLQNFNFVSSSSVQTVWRQSDACGNLTMGLIG